MIKSKLIAIATTTLLVVGCSNANSDSVAKVKAYLDDDGNFIQEKLVGVDIKDAESTLKSLIKGSVICPFESPTYEDFNNLKPYYLYEKMTENLTNDGKESYVNELTFSDGVHYGDIYFENDIFVFYTESEATKFVKEDSSWIHDGSLSYEQIKNINGLAPIINVDLLQYKTEDFTFKFDFNYNQDGIKIIQSSNVMFLDEETIYYDIEQSVELDSSDVFDSAINMSREGIITFNDNLTIDIPTEISDYFNA